MAGFSGAWPGVGLCLHLPPSSSRAFGPRGRPPWPRSEPWAPCWVMTYICTFPAAATCGGGVIVLQARDQGWQGQGLLPKVALTAKPGPEPGSVCPGSLCCYPTFRFSFLRFSGWGWGYLRVSWKLVENAGSPEPTAQGPAGRAWELDRNLCLDEAPQAVARPVVTDQGDSFSPGPTSGDRVPLPQSRRPGFEAG